MRHRTRWPVTLLSMVLVLSVLGVSPVLAVTPPQGGAEAKATDFLIVPPWDSGSHEVLCGYGCGLHGGYADTGSANDHYALDFDLVSGEPVHPVADGTVLYAAAGTAGASGEGWKPYGNLVYVKHGGSGYTSMYAHLDSIDVEPGDPVTTATKLGGAGTTGTDDVHLHFALFEGASQAQGQQPYGGVSVVPEPFAQCSGDCEDLAEGSVMTRTSSGTGSTAVGPSGKPRSRPAALPARLPWSAGQAHEVISRYDIDSPEGFGLLFEIAAPDTVYPVYPGEVIYAGCATGRSAPLGRMVVVRRTFGDFDFDMVYGHLTSIDPAFVGASLLTPRSIGQNQPLGTVGSLTDVSLDACPGSAATDRLYVGGLRDADVRMSGEISGGQPVYAEPMVGRGAYEGFTWWDGPATAADLADGVGAPWGRWAKSAARDGAVITFGEPITLSAEVRNDVPLKELRFTAYYQGWPRAKSANRLDGFTEHRTWRILAVCRPPGVGGEPAKTRGCKWDGSATDAIVTFEWDPTLPVTGKVTPWQPLTTVAISEKSDDCVPVTLSFDVFDQAGYRRNAPGGVKKARKCPAAVASTGSSFVSAQQAEPETDPVFGAEKKTRQQDRWAYLQPLKPPAAPGNVDVRAQKRTEHIEDHFGWMGTTVRYRLTWNDVSGEEGYNVYVSDLYWRVHVSKRTGLPSCLVVDTAKPVLLRELPADATSLTDVYTYGAPNDPSTRQEYGRRYFVTAWNSAGPSPGAQAEHRELSQPTPQEVGLPRCR